jgi:hypothetical protein
MWGMETPIMILVFCASVVVDETFASGSTESKRISLPSTLRLAVRPHARLPVDCPVGIVGADLSTRTKVPIIGGTEPLAGKCVGLGLARILLSEWLGAYPPC